jgi:hypothetical protein
MTISIKRRDLLEHITKAADSTRDSSEAYRCRSFIANLCGRLERDYPEIAKALAIGGGMPYLYEPKADGDA